MNLESKRLEALDMELLNIQQIVYETLLYCVINRTERNYLLGEIYMEHNYLII